MMGLRENWNYKCIWTYWLSGLKNPVLNFLNFLAVYHYFHYITVEQYITLYNIFIWKNVRT